MIGKTFHICFSLLIYRQTILYNLVRAPTQRVVITITTAQQVSMQEKELPWCDPSHTGAALTPVIIIQLSELRCLQLPTRR